MKAASGKHPVGTAFFVRPEDHPDDPISPASVRLDELPIFASTNNERIINIKNQAIMKIIFPFDYFSDNIEKFSMPGVTVRNNAGAKVRILCVDAEITGYPVVGVTEHDDPELNSADSYTAEGKYIGDEDSNMDLFVEVDSETARLTYGVNPFSAAIIASILFGDPSKYTKQELSQIMELSLALSAE